MFITMRVVQVDTSERFCFFHSENILEDSDLPFWRYVSIALTQERNKKSSYITPYFSKG